MTQHTLHLYTPDGTSYGILDMSAQISLMYDILLNDVSPIAFSLPSDNQYAGTIAIDDVVEVRRQNTVSNAFEQQKAYLINGIEITQDENGLDTYIYSGVSLERLLQQRLIDPDDDPLAANDFVTRDGKTETIMHDFVNYNIGPGASALRTVSGWIMGADGQRGVDTGRRVSRDNLLEVLQDLAVQGDVHFRVNWTESGGVYNPQFETYVGNDYRRRTDATNYIIFSLERGNIQSAAVSLDYSEHQNTCYVLWEEGFTYRVVSSYALANRFARSEYTLDAGGEESALAAQRAGVVENIKNVPIRTAQFEINQNTVAYKSDWDIGDKVNVKIRELEDEYQISGVSIEIESNGLEIVVPQLEVVP